MPIIIKRYQNRKLYDTQSKRYITLDDIEELIKSEQEIKVIDNITGNDITALTISQVIFEIEKNHSGFLPIKLLTSLVQSGGNKIEDLRRSIFNSLSLSRSYDAEISRRINLLVETGELTEETGSMITKKLISVNQQYFEPDNEIETRVSIYLNEKQIPTNSDLQELINRIDEMSQRLDALKSENNPK